METLAISSPLDVVFDDVADGLSLRKALAKHSMGSKKFYRLLSADVQHDRRYAQAIAIRADLLADEVVDIADEEKDAARARNRMDARKWAAGKMNPQKFSDRLDITVTERVDLNAALDQARQRLRPMSDQQDSVTDLVPNESGTYEPRTTDESSDDVDIFG